MTASSFIERRYGVLLTAIVLIGLALRIACARGDMWLDETWSLVQARDAGTPIGVFIGINHDNNHHLNSLWLQWIGFGASPLLLRALSIASGTIATLIAARIAETRGRGIALITAWLFAVSPILVTLGSEARGYATMSVALLTAVLFVDRWLAADVRYRRPVVFALCFGLGALAQLTMVFGICALLGWSSFVLWRRNGFRGALIEMLQVLAPALITLVATLALVFLPGWISGTGFRFGRYDPFEMLLYLHGMIEMFGYTIGVPWKNFLVMIIVLIALVLARQFGASRIAFYRLAIFAFPLLLGVLQSGNVGHARYYLVAGLALLLLLGEMIGTALWRRGWQRLFGGTVLAIFSVGALAADIELARNLRADPGAAIRAMMARAPAGTRMLLDRDTGLSVMEAAAAHARYPLAITQRPCANVRFLFIDRFKGEQFPKDPVVVCGRRFAPIVLGRMTGMSGADWTLYEPRP